MGCGNVFWYIDNNRPRSSGSCYVEGFLQGYCQFVQILHQKIMFDAGTTDTDRVDLLEGIATDRMTGHLSSNNNQRD